jgi:hypothetical protein
MSGPIETSTRARVVEQLLRETVLPQVAAINRDLHGPDEHGDAEDCQLAEDLRACIKGAIDRAREFAENREFEAANERPRV